MRWLSAAVVTVVLVTSPTAVAALALPAAVAPPPPVEHGMVVTPVAGAVQREFAPPATRYGAGHRGVDLEAAPGEPVAAAIGGVVTFAGTVALVGWVTVDHGGGLSTTYGPLEPRIVTAGQQVARGEVLGFLAAEAGHLDWGARLEGEYIDPLSLLEPWEAYLTSDTVADERAILAAAAPLAGGAAGQPGRFVRPASGPVTSSFGPRRHPVTGEHRAHAGLDIGAPDGAPVWAAAAGVVTFAGEVSGYGRTVMVDHGNGLTTLYAHLSGAAVGAGQRLTAGARLGSVGATGLATGPHLHFEVRRDGVPQDPAAWL